jgi:hypothetical protein
VPTLHFTERLHIVCTQRDLKKENMGQKSGFCSSTKGVKNFEKNIV